ncbi:hypothetical protein AB6A40_001632 [Gnathostoma spinigerum]|uniref:Uncharacterized protein n=1 Tax=Gnathostoma spinigerum TaxID=75299 RepID=A0ABD6EDK0_9BILA
MGDAVKGTPESQKYVSTGVNFITNPKVKNSTWNRGLLFNGTVDFSSPVDKCEFWSSLLDSLKATNYHLGGGSLTVSPDSSLLNPCRKDEVVITGVPCGNTYCRPELGEECIAEKLCGCPNGQKRNGTEGKCRQVESWHIPLWVIRNGSTPLEYTDSIANPQDSIHKQLVTAFEKGIQDSYDHTPLRKGFVVAEVNDIVRPSSVNKTFDRGIIYNFTTSFVRGSVETPSKVYTDLYEYIVNHNNYEVGNSEQYISPNQANPFDVCFKSDCHPHAICKSSGRTYTCECPADFRDLDVSHPGHRCIPLRGYNECEKPEDNECDVNARCIDEDYLYRCECVKPWVNAAKPGQIPGSVCQIDYCSDVNFCPANTTCKNENDKAQCVCLPGYIDIGKAATSEPQRGNTDQKNLEDVHCVKTIDVNECALGLHNCSAVAICTDLPNGYKCECPEGYTDGGSPPGRVCAALLCGLCNGHGDCVTNPETNNITCACVEGYTGEFCEVAPSSIPLLLWLLLALLFLLLTLCCCLYFCLKTRCFGGGVGHKKLAESSEGTLSIPDYWTIPRAQIKRPDQMAIAKRREDEQVANAEALSRGLYDEDYRDREARDAYGRGYDDRDGRRRYGDYYNDRGSIISGSSGSEDENIVKKVTTEVTRKEITTRRVEGQEGGTTTYKITSSTASGGGGGFDSSEMHTQSFGSRLPIETEAEQFAASSSDHYMQDGAAGGDIYTTTNKIRSREAEGGYDDYVSDDEAGIFDRTTKYTTERDYLPSADGRSGRERLRNTMLTTSTANETRYF